MSLIFKGIKQLRHPRVFVHKLYGFILEVSAKFMTDEMFLKLWWRYVMGTSLNLDAPRTFNEKLQWLKLHDRQPKYTMMVDKAAAKGYVASVVGNEVIIPTLDVYNSVDDINIDNLPNQFVLKCTHDSGGVVICEDKRKFDLYEAKKQLRKDLARSFYVHTREWPYLNVPPRVIAEEFLYDEEGLRDYKFFCFNGKVEFFKVDLDRFTSHRANYYSVDGTILPFGEAQFPPDFERVITFPQNLPEMIKIATQLSIGIPFVRIDLYNIKGKIYFGEMTFYPASGFGKFTIPEWDTILGEKISLPRPF